METDGEVVQVSLKELYLGKALKDKWTLASSVRMGEGMGVGRGERREKELEGERLHLTEGKPVVVLSGGRGEYYENFPKGDCGRQQ